jgi:transcriptional regulator with GAF, ATPase, and Fis domain
VFPIDVPPLRDRSDDVVQLASHFLDRACRELGHRPLTLSRQQAGLLKRYNWPGNVRELKNVIERAVILSQGKVLRLDLAMANIFETREVDEEREHTHSVAAIMTEADLRDLERRNMLVALEQAEWRVSGPNGAAALLGVKPTTFTDRMKKHRIKRPRGAAA